MKDAKDSTPGAAADREAQRAERKALFDRIYAFYDVKILATALETGLFQQLETRKTPAEIAAGASLPERSVRALLISLGAMGLTDCSDGRYAMSPRGKRFFAKDSREFMGDAVRFAEWQFESLSRFDECIKEGKVIWSGFDHYLHVADDQASRRERDQRIFNAALASSATPTAKTVLANADLSGSRRLLDIGGNLGVFSSVVLEKHPDMRATVFDLPQVVPQTLKEVERRGLASRIDAVGGNFVEDPWPAGHDLVTFIRIFATRERDEIVHLLRKAHGSLPSGGRAFFYEEHVLPRDRNAVPAGAAWASMFLTIGSRGEIRHVDEWEAMFTEAGFTNLESAVGDPWGLVMGTKP